MNKPSKIRHIGGPLDGACSSLPCQIRKRVGKMTYLCVEFTTALGTLAAYIPEDHYDLPDFITFAARVVEHDQATGAIA